MTETAPRRDVVLIVDDDRQQAEQIASFLTRYGISVVQEDNGFAAVNTIRRVQPAVVVMDVRMPGLDGIGAAKLAAKMEPSPRIILMSGCVDQVRKATKEDLDVFAVVEKPIPLKVLARFINNALARA